MNNSTSKLPMEALRTAFGRALQENVTLANYTTANVGGPADALLVAQSANELEQIVRRLWDMELPYRILGSGSNVLISDKGLREVIVINHARTIKINTHSDPPTVWAESGAMLGTIGKRAALRGLAGFEWAAYIPGTLGGAVYGNAGAHGSDMQNDLVMADILHPEKGKVQWSSADFEYGYRTSILKRHPGKAVILAAEVRLAYSTREQVENCMETILAHRQRVQPPGSNLGSIFKNPPGDKAGRLIEAAGLKGTRIGNVEISQRHANFFVSHTNAAAEDIYRLIQLAQTKVMERFGINLELEIELLGKWV